MLFGKVKDYRVKKVVKSQIRLIVKMVYYVSGKIQFNINPYPAIFILSAFSNSSITYLYQID